MRGDLYLAAFTPARMRAISVPRRRWIAACAWRSLSHAVTFHEAGRSAASGKKLPYRAGAPLKPGDFGKKEWAYACAYAHSGKRGLYMPGWTMRTYMSTAADGGPPVSCVNREWTVHVPPRAC